MRRKKIWTLGLVACLSLAIAGFADHKGVPHGKKDGGGGGKIPVTVTFRDCIENGDIEECPFGSPEDRIKSDFWANQDCGHTLAGDCPYTDGAIIGAGNGSFHWGIGINTGGPTGKRPGTRRLFLDFRDCASPGQCNPPPSFFPDDFAFVGAAGAVNWHTSGGIDLRDMFVNVPRDDLELLVGVNLESIGEGFWRLDFRPNDIEGCEGSSSSISVTRTADDTWVIEAGPTNIACLLQPGEKLSTFKFSGRYHMPFKITLVCIDPTQCVAPPSPSP